MTLDKELETFRRLLPELLKEDQGKWVLILGERKIGIFDHKVGALRAGYERANGGPFLVKRIEEMETVHFWSGFLGEVGRCPT